MTAFTRKPIYLAPSHTRGIGVFAGAPIAKGEIIEVCKVLRFQEKYPEIRDYIFNWGDSYAFPLGYGVLYNHSDEPNAEHESKKEEDLLIYRASRDIHPDEEIFIFYGKDWFQSRREKQIHFPKYYHLKQRVIYSTLYALALLAAVLLAFFYL